MKKLLLFTKEKNKNIYYMIIRTGNESKIELKEGLNEENKNIEKKVEVYQKIINDKNREEVLILKYKTVKDNETILIMGNDVDEFEILLLLF